MSGFVKASVAAGWSREDATVRIQKRGVQSLKEEPLDRGQRTDSMGHCRVSISQDLVMGVPGAGHLEALQCHQLAGDSGRKYGLVGHPHRDVPGQPREMTVPQQKLPSCLPSQVWSSENGVL